ncbi:MAG: C_GCAxxG_C_C family protein [Candidatus Thorarchaeota archaeon]|nr:MAG: C_GCAxxG_C_C family protein [Candidatus Thorarchaeota archaeon]
MPDDPKKLAREYFASGYNCTQAVLRSVLEERGLMFNQVPLVASGFGGGIGRQGGICGAATGGVMAIGMLIGEFAKDNTEQKNLAYEKVTEFLNRFRNEYSTVECRDLIGYDVSDHDSRKKAYDDGVFARLCPGFVESAVEYVLDIFPI